jgi:ribonuclease D
MQPPRVIENQQELDGFIEQVRNSKYVAVDSESDNYFAYKPRLCLIQISNGHGDFILDPLALQDLSALARILADASVEKVFHAAENDLIGMKKDFGFEVRNIFDTSIACRLLGRKRLGLARILSEEFGVTIDKKYQRCDWQKRPLSVELLYYAQLDTHFLLRLRHRLYDQLVKSNLWPVARRKFARLETIKLNPTKAWDANGYRRLKGAQELPEASLRVLKELFSYREHLARRINKAPFRVMNNEFMVRLARHVPENVDDLRSVRGLPHRFKGKRAERLLRVVQRAKL